MAIHEQIQSISSKEALSSFIMDLRKELLEAPEKWENSTLDSYLEALSAWVIDMDGYYVNHGKPIPKEPSWSVIADMLYAATLYE